MDSFEDVPSFDFVIPLRPFERHLLEGIRRTYSSVIDHALKDFQPFRVGGERALDRLEMDAC
jgi:hypothetical protein